MQTHLSDQLIWLMDEIQQTSQLEKMVIENMVFRILSQCVPENGEITEEESEILEHAFHLLKETYPFLQIQFIRD